MEAQCRQDTRESVSEVRKELGFLVLDVGLTIATVGLGSAAIAGRLAIRAGGQVSKAQRLQNLGLLGVDISFSAPYINQAMDDCDDYMNQLEQKAGEETNDVCEELPVRSKLKSDLTSCLLTASLASLPLAVPAFAVASRAGFKALKNTPPSSPTDPTPPAQLTPSERQFTGPSTNSNAEAAATTQLTPTTPRNSAESRAVARSTNQPSSQTDDVIDLVEIDGVYQRPPSTTKRTGSPKPKTSTRTSSQPNPKADEIIDVVEIDGVYQKPPGTAQRARSSSKQNSQRTSKRFFPSLKDTKNRAQRLARRIRQMIIGNNITKTGAKTGTNIIKTGNNSLGDYLQQTRTYLGQQNPGMNEAQISQTIADELKKNGGVNIEYSKGLFKIKNNEGVFVVDSSGKMRKITENPSSLILAGRQRSQPKSTVAARSGAIALRSSNLPNSRIAGRTGRQTGRSIHRGSRPGQKISETAGRTARSANRKTQIKSSPTARNIQAGVAGKVIGQGIIGGTAVGGAGAAAAVADNAVENSNNANGGADRLDSRRSNGDERRSRSGDDNDKQDRDRNKKKDLDCSKYKGGSPQNRREQICYYYMRTQQLTAETQNIQKNTQALNNFKSKVWLGVKENQVPPSFFTNIQKNIQKSKIVTAVTADYLNNFRLMYDISRIQNQYLNANDQNQLREIIQEADQYMKSANLDSYSHIQESVNILMNRLQIPPSASFLSL